MKKIKCIKRVFSFILIACSIITLQINVKALYGDTAGGGTAGANTGCSGGTCWDSPTPGVGHQLYGIRVTIVDGNGNRVSARSVDYIGTSAHANTLNTSTGYFRCTNDRKDRLSYLKGSSCSWSAHNGTSFAIYWGQIPDIFHVANSAVTLKNTILNMSKESFKTTFLDPLGYTIPATGMENHYFIIEPLTMRKVNGINRYGTHYELLKHYRSLTATIDFFANRVTPLSIYATGNTDIKGSGGFNAYSKTYFNGLLTVANIGSQTTVYNGKRQLLAQYVFQYNLAYGIGIYWMPELPVGPENPTPTPTPTPTPEPQICTLNNTNHFSSETSGPNGENCCQYVLDNISTYNINKAQLFAQYPHCRAYILDQCEFKVDFNTPSCGTDGDGEIHDLRDWDCIYASAYSNDEAIKGYFLKYGSVTDSCSVYCRDDLYYNYPISKFTALAGNYFTINGTDNAGGTSSFHTYIDADDIFKIKAANLGKITVEIVRSCNILGTANNQCKDAVSAQLNSINAPSIDFAYESKYYNNPIVTLTPTRTKHTIIGYTGTTEYTYSLPNNTYKYVAKDSGTSYKNKPATGEYIEIENHLPIHFSKKNYTANYQIAITKFNIQNFDNLILKGQTMPVKFSSSIETYIKTLIDEGYGRPININGTYYFDPAFIKSLNNQGYSVDNLLQMTCGNTNDYSCTNDSNGVACYDKNTNSNSEQTYALFNACINSEIEKINYEKVSYKNDMLYECSFNVVQNTKNVCVPNDPTCVPDNDEGLLNVIYRPISLDNPFPSIDADGRVTGVNWCYGDNCSNTNPVVEKVITNNRDVTTEEVYRQLDPLYTITLTPALIKEIREYNDKNDYDDFTLDCDNNGKYCKSTFIRDEFKNYFYGCGIENKSGGLRCQEYDKW